MKRQHPPDDDEDGRGKPKAREDQAQALDLNATPRGFDLNAPFSEEEGQEWIAGSGQEDALHREIFKQHLEPAADLGIDEDLDILHSIWSAWTQENWQRLDEILESVLDEISRFPSSPPRYQYLTCFYISKKLPNAFCLPRTYKALLSFLDSSPSEASTKKQNFLPGFSCKLLFRAFNEKPEWPLEFVQAYLDDAINLRNWVDSEHCKEFVANILTSFDEDLTVGTEDPSDVKGDTAQCSLKNRYPGDEIRQKAKAEFMQALNHLLKVPLIKENPRILRMLTLGVNYEEVRVIASSMMEGWLNTPFHFRRAKLLLDRVLHFTNGTTMKDFETVANILSLRLNQGVSQMKNASTSFYTELVIQIVQKRPEYSSLALKTFLTAELNSTGPHNMKGISVVLKALPDSLSPERALALVIKELVLSDDHVGRLQEAVTRVLKQLKEISPCLLCRALLEPWDSILQQQDSARQSWFKQVIELSCHFLIQAATPFSSDEKFLVAISATGKRSRDESLKEILPLFKDLSMKIMTFQEEALTWCVDVLSSQLSAGDCKFFTTAVQKLMFLEPVEEYNLSSSSGTVELNSFQLVAFSMHASEEVLARIILMGISNQFPMQQEDALHIIEKLVWRAAASDKHAFGTLFADSLQLPAAIMKLSSFYLPSVSRQPLPQLVIKDLYWRSCLVIIVIAAYNPATIGKSVWENFPSVRYLLQYLITEGTKSGLSAADILEDKEAVLNDIKAEEILDSFLIKELECEPTNVMEPWKGNIMLLNTQTNRRKPPTYILEELKDIEPSYDLGRRIRSCTEPSFLCNTVSSQQDFKEAWEWIQKVAGKQPEVLGMLPCDWQVTSFSAPKL
ncbi:integrator complex subunit 1-like isoform X3 [Selaginella moellendorffii]|uniref:integrator complex subunit 1-like isoform X3 n=1 Tax=Selaginella moellendorffii TaxID=88036 RepID=UPI000D1CC5AE|nr:integrator complex subunit 1-like isoform X3 [Selaginella moellendorffii]|eukprot:XP_024529261.1 integrator complex subunit 1-like isoform X3 [Selaginella moellendorffii]